MFILYADLDNIWSAYSCILYILTNHLSWEFLIRVLGMLVTAPR